MIRSTARVLLAAWFAAGSLPAQTTWIVDSANRKGTSFTDIPQAIAAANHGDIVIIRKASGSYTGFTTSKALTLIGDGGRPIVRPPIIVKNLSAGRSFVAANLHVAGTVGPFLLFGTVELLNNAGRVHLQDVNVVSTYQYGAFYPVGTGCIIDNCSSVTVTRGRFEGAPAVLATQSRLEMAGATVLGSDETPTIQPFWAERGMWLRQCTALLSRADVSGGMGSSGSGKPAIHIEGGSVTVTGDATTAINAGASPISIPAIATTGGAALVDTGIAVQGSSGGPPIGGTAQITRRRVVSLTGNGAPLGGTLSAEVVSPAGDLFWLVAGFPATPLSTPFGELSLDPRVVLLLGAGTQGPSGRFTWNANIPNAGALRGAVLGLQAANLYQATQQVEYSSLVVVVIE